MKRPRKRIVHRTIHIESVVAVLPARRQGGQYNWAIVGWQVVTSGPCVRTKHDKSEIDPRLERCDRIVYGQGLSS